MAESTTSATTGTTTGATAAAPTTTTAALGAKLADSSKLDMVFVMDCTGSMGSYIASAQATIQDIVTQIVSAEKADVRFALIAYRDHPPQDSSFVTQIHPFSSSVRTMRENLNTLSANGGGDGPEAVADGLQAALKLDYREDATKVCILIADAPPHGLSPSGDGFPNGCPCGFDPMVVCREMAEAEIALYVIGCEPSISPYKNFFMALSHLTGGQYCPLGSASTLSQAVVSGVREEISMTAMRADIRTAQMECASLDEEGQAQYIHNKLKSKGVRTRQMRHDGGGSLGITEEATRLAKNSNMADVRAAFTPAAHTGAPIAGAPRSASFARKRCAAPGAPPPGGLMTRATTAVRSFFGSTTTTSSSSTAASGAGCGSAAPKAFSLDADADVDALCDTSAPAFASAPASAPAPPAPAMAMAVPTSYCVAEDEVSLEQVRRMNIRSKKSGL